MSTREVRLELLVGAIVRAKNGRAIGRLEEITADDNWTVREYHIGTAALLERLSVRVRWLFGVRTRPRGLGARWDQLDVSEPTTPRLTCRLEELRRLEA